MPTSATSEEQEVVARHFQYLTESFKRGRVKFVGRTFSPPFVGIAVFDAEDVDDAQEFADQDLAVTAKVFSARVQPFEVFFATAKGNSR